VITAASNSVTQLIHTLACENCRSQSNGNYVRFQFLTATGMNMAAFWDADPYSLVGDHRDDGGSKLL
jgi:hypothetical protein